MLITLHSCCSAYDSFKNQVFTTLVAQTNYYVSIQRVSVVTDVPRAVEMAPILKSYRHHKKKRFCQRCCQWHHSPRSFMIPQFRGGQGLTKNILLYYMVLESPLQQKSLMCHFASKVLKIVPEIKLLVFLGAISQKRHNLVSLDLFNVMMLKQKQE